MKRIMGLLVIIALTFLSGYFISSLINREVSVENIKVNETIAIVNSDIGISDEEGNYTNFANYYIEKLQEDNTFNSELVSLSEAQKGVEDNIYSAYISFPANFSENIMSIETDTPYSTEITYKLNNSLNTSDITIKEQDILLFINSIDNDVNYLYTTNYYEELNTTKDNVELIDDVKENTELKIAEHKDTLTTSLDKYHTSITKEQAEYNKSLNENYATVEIADVDNYEVQSDSELSSEVKLDTETLETEYQVNLDDETLSKQGENNLDVFLNYQVNQYHKIDSSASTPNNIIYLDSKCYSTNCNTNNYYINKSTKVVNELETNYTIYDKDYLLTLYNNTKDDFDALNPDYDFTCLEENYIDLEDPSLGCKKYSYEMPLEYSREYVMYRIKVEAYTGTESDETIKTDLLDYYKNENTREPTYINELYTYASFLITEQNARDYVSSEIYSKSCNSNQTSARCEIKTSLDQIYHPSIYSFDKNSEDILPLYTTGLDWTTINNEINTQTRTNNSELSLMLRTEQQNISEQSLNNFNNNKELIETQVNEGINTINETHQSYNESMQRSFGGENCPACINLSSPNDTKELEENYGLLLENYSTDNTTLNEEYNNTLQPFFTLNSQYNNEGVLNNSHIDLVANPVRASEEDNSLNALTYITGEKTATEYLLLAIIIVLIIVISILNIIPRGKK